MRNTPKKLDMPKVTLCYSWFDWPRVCPMKDDDEGGWKSYEFRNKHSKQRFQVRMSLDDEGSVNELEMEMLG